MMNRTQGKKIVIFKGIIDSLDAFAEELNRSFTELSCDVLMVNVNDLRCYEDEAFTKIEEYVSCEGACCIFMNNIGMLMADASGGNYWNRSGVRCFDILADPPFFYHKAIESDIENVTFICVDQEQSDYINRYYGEGSDYQKRTGRVRKSLYMPLAGVGAGLSVGEKAGGGEADAVQEAVGVSDDADQGRIAAVQGISQKMSLEIPLKDRSINVVFTGNVRDYRDIDTETSGMDESLLQLWDAVYEHIKQDTTLTIERAIRVCMQEYELKLSDEMVHQIILLFKRMDSVIRAKYRAEVIRTLVDGGVKVDVFGDGWELIEVEHSENLIIHEKVSYMESVALMKDVKVSINVMPWFKKGFHDRVATAMIAGCVSVTDFSEYLSQNYIDGTDIILYDLDCLKELPDRVKSLLEEIEYGKLKDFKIEDFGHGNRADPVAGAVKGCSAAKIAEAGKQKAQRQDTWKQRAEWFLNVMQQ